MERLQQIGRIAPLHASRIKRSRMGIGFEKLDRKVFEPEKAYLRPTTSWPPQASNGCAYRAAGHGQKRKKAYTISPGWTAS